MGGAFLVKNIKRDDTPSIVTDGLLLYLDAGKSSSYPGSGTTWFDLSGNGYNGTLVNGVGFTTTNGGSLDFNNTQSNEASPGQFVNLGKPAQLVGRQLPVTIMGFFKPDTLGTFDAVYSLYDNTVNSQLVSMIRIDGGSILYYTTASNGGFQLQSFGSPNLNQWNFFAITVSGTISSPTLFARINNTTQTFNLNALSSSPSTNVNPLIGGTQFQNGDTPGAREHFDGLIPIIMVYNRALSTSEIDTNFNTFRNRFGL